MKRMSLAFVIVSAAVAGCGSKEELPGLATATITNVPAGVACVQVTVSDANHFVQRNFDVMAGQSSVLDLKGLPVGVETFGAAAFGAPCAYIGGLDPNWISDPVSAYLSPGHVTAVTLVLRKAAGATVGIEFEDDDGGVPNDGGGDGGVPDLAHPSDSGAFGKLLANPAIVDFSAPGTPPGLKAIVNVINTGSAPSSPMTFQTQGPFSVDATTCPPMGLPPGQSCPVIVQFIATAPGSYDGVLIINTIDPSLVVPLHGVRP